MGLKTERNVKGNSSDFSRIWIVSTLKGRQNRHSQSEELTTVSKVLSMVLHEIGTEQ